MLKTANWTMDHKETITKKEGYIEIIFIIILVGAMFFFVNGKLYDNRLVHSMPFSYFATDGFAYLLLTEHAYISGNQLYHPYYEAGGYYDVLWIHGLTIYSVSAILAKTSGIPVYDAIYIMASVMVILNCLAMYFFIREYNKNVAIIAIGFFALFFVKNFYVSYFWGELGAVSGMLFLTGMLWAVSKIDIKKGFLLLSITSIAAILAHIPEFIFAALIILGYLVFKIIIEKKIPWKDVKWITIAMFITVVLTSYYLAVFAFGMFQTQGSNPLVLKPSEMGSLKVVFFQDIGWPAIIALAIGITYFSYITIKNKKIIPILFFSLMLFIIGFSNYFGFGYRAFHIRAFWPIFLAPLFGLGVYIVIKTIKKNISQVVSIIVALIIFASITLSYYSPIRGPGAITQEQYDAFKWIDKNTAQTDKIFVFYGDGYSKTARLIQRLTYVLDVNDYVQSLQKGTIKNIYTVNLFTLTNGNLLYWDGFMKPGYHADFSTSYHIQVNVCDFEYYLFDKKSAYSPGLAQANVYIMNLFLSNGMKEVYSNDAVSVIYNNGIRENCINMPGTNISTNSTDQSIKESTSQSINQSTDESKNQSTIQK